MTIRERAIIAALNFAGLTISTADGTYETLILVISDAMDDYAKIAIEEEREACAEIADHWFGDCADQIRARSEGKEER